MAYSIGRLVIYPTTNISPSQFLGSISTSNWLLLLKNRYNFDAKIEFKTWEKRFTKAALQGESADRPSGNFSPSLWGDFFDSFTLDLKAAEEYAYEIERLKKEVRDMLLSTTKNIVEKITLIDTLERLSLSYHFEKEIQKELDNIFMENRLDVEAMKHWDLHTVALLFLIFRQHGFDISCDVFNKFKDSNGRFDESHKSDVKGLLSLYEAAHLRRHGEDILEEAFVFTKDFLKKMVPSFDFSFQKQVNHALQQTIRRGWRRTEARYNIGIYEEDEITRNDNLLRIAKLDYNFLQMLHKQELCQIRRWWKNLNLSKFRYPRDRIVEGYYAALGMYFEPQYSLARIMATKTLVMTSVIDDTFDSYATIDELEIFTEAIQRWSIAEIHRLPSYMKTLYATLIKLHQEYEVELEKQGRAYAVDYARQRWKELVKSYHKEAQWFSKGYLPDFDEYMENALITTICFLLIPALLLGVESATKETFEFLKGNPRIVTTMAKLSRVIDDVATYKIEKARGQVATGIECYMKQFGVTEEQAFQKFHEMAEDAWKDLNEDLLLNKSSIPVEVAKTALNQARLMDVFYKHDEDGYTNPEKLLKPQIISSLVDPIEL